MASTSSKKQLSRNKSVMKIEANPLESGSAAITSVKVENLSDATPIAPDQLKTFLRALEQFEENEERLKYIEENKTPYLFTSNDLAAILEVTTSLKTKLNMIGSISPRLTDPKAKTQYFMDIFRFADEKSQVEEILKARAQVLANSVFTNNESVKAFRGNQGGRGGMMAGRGRGGRTMNSNPSWPARQPSIQTNGKVITISSPGTGNRKSIRLAESFHVAPSPAKGSVVPDNILRSDSTYSNGDVPRATLPAAVETTLTSPPKQHSSNQEEVESPALATPSGKVITNMDEVFSFLDEYSVASARSSRRLPPTMQTISEDHDHDQDSDSDDHEDSRLGVLVNAMDASVTSPGAVDSSHTTCITVAEEAELVTALEQSLQREPTPPRPRALLREPSSPALSKEVILQTESLKMVKVVKATGNTKIVLEETGKSSDSPAAQPREIASEIPAPSISSGSGEIATAGSASQSIAIATSSVVAEDSPTTSPRKQTSGVSSLQAMVLHGDRSPQKHASKRLDGFFSMDSQEEESDERAVAVAVEEADKERGAFGSGAVSNTSSSSDAAAAMGTATTTNAAPTVAVSSPAAASAHRSPGVTRIMSKHLSGTIDALSTPNNATSPMVSAEKIPLSVYSSGTNSSVGTAAPKASPGVVRTAPTAPVQHFNRPATTSAVKADVGTTPVKTVTATANASTNATKGPPAPLDTASPAKPRRFSEFSAAHQFLAKAEPQSTKSEPPSTSKAASSDAKDDSGQHGGPLHIRRPGSFSMATGPFTTGSAPGRRHSEFSLPASFVPSVSAAPSSSSGGSSKADNDLASKYAACLKISRDRFLALEAQDPLTVTPDNVPQFSYAELLRRNYSKRYEGLVQSELEKHLVAEDFDAAFGKSKEKFFAQVRWRQVEDKKKAMLF